MKLRCRLSWHRWGRWQQRALITHIKATDMLGARRPELDETRTQRVQYRHCLACGLEQTRRP